MPVIKRYPNRKLYDTEAKKYVTLEGIAELIRKRQDVQVVDNATGEDLTALTLSLIIFEQQKRHSAFIPHSVLAGLIRAGGDTLNTLRQNLVASLGLSRLVDEEIERRIKRLVVALEPAIIVIMGVLVAGIVMSVMLPLLDVSTIG